LAIVKLAERDDREVVDALLGRIRTETSDKVISALVSVLGRLCTNEQIFELAPFLKSSNEWIVANAVESMGQIRHPRSSDLILPMLSSRNNRVKANAAMALFAAGRVEVIDTLKPMLMYSDPLMRSSAAFAIGELSMIAQKDQLVENWRRSAHGVKVFLGELQECVPMLVSLLKDPEPMVKRQAIIALGKIKDKSAVLPIIDNIDLERDSKELLRDVGQALRAIGSHKLVREILSKLS
jgi:HEAT repeat protein